MIDPRKCRTDVWSYKTKRWIVITNNETGEEIYSAPISIKQAKELTALGFTSCRTDEYGPSCNQPD